MQHRTDDKKPRAGTPRAAPSTSPTAAHVSPAQTGTGKLTLPDKVVHTGKEDRHGDKVPEKTEKLTKKTREQTRIQNIMTQKNTTALKQLQSKTVHKMPQQNCERDAPGLLDRKPTPSVSKCEHSQGTGTLVDIIKWAEPAACKNKSSLNYNLCTQLGGKGGGWGNTIISETMELKPGMHAEVTLPHASQ